MRYVHVTDGEITTAVTTMRMKKGTAFTSDIFNKLLVNGLMQKKQNSEIAMKNKIWPVNKKGHN